MFQFGGFALSCHAFSMAGSPIRKSPDQVIFADPQGLSQLITSFIASESQGIPRILFLTFFRYAAFCAGMRALRTRVPKGTSALLCALLVLTSSNMSKNFSIPEANAPIVNMPLVTGTGDGGE